MGQFNFNNTKNGLFGDGISPEVAPPFPDFQNAVTRVQNQINRSRQTLLNRFGVGFDNNGLDSPILYPLVIDGVLFPQEPIIEVSRGNNIVTTELAGGIGTVKEDMGIDDWSVTITGTITNDEGDFFPEDKLREILSLADRRKALPVISEILDWYGIQYIVIESVNFGFVAGLQNAQIFQIQALSDLPVQLNLLEF